jgi:transcriptional regulator with XRE-family HTH domain
LSSRSVVCYYWHMVNWTMGRLPDHWSGILASIRKESGLTRPELSMLSGVGTSTIENYERNKIKEPSIYKVEQLLKCMGYELDALKESS